MILVIGEILFDVFPNYRSLGGAPFNFAYHLKNFGFDVRFISRIGIDDAGKEIMHKLELSRFNLDDLQIDEDHPTGSVNVHLDENGEPKFDIIFGVAYDYIEFIPKYHSNLIDAARMIYFGSLVQRSEAGHKNLQTFIARNSSDSIHFYDINLRPGCYNVDIIKKSLIKTDILKLSTDELEKLKQLRSKKLTMMSLSPGSAKLKVQYRILHPFTNPSKPFLRTRKVMSSQKYHIQMFSIHGLLRAENMQLGHDADTGGQIKYVVELCKALSQSENVKRVELFSRLIRDKAVSEDYAQPVEQVNDKFSIIRIQCGGKKYMRKELLWPHLDEYVDKTIKYIKRQSAIPDIVHGHYPDAGYVAMQLSEIFGIPFIFNGHSLGRSKLRRLTDEGMKKNAIIKKDKIDHRIQMEEEVLKKADLIIASTHQEVKDQYGQYDNKDIPKYHVIPPGLDVDKFYPFYHNMLPETDKEEIELYAQASMLEELNRFFMHPDRPVILSLCRPDKRKNIAGLIKAYGEDLELQSMANLAIFAGIRKDITDMEDNERDVLTEILLLMDKYDLYGKIAIPQKHDFEHEVPELYRIAAEKKGIFANSALAEPFGLTLIEAAACGLPVIAPDDGGPSDIIKNCECGILVNTSDTKAIARGIKQIIADSQKWKQYSKSGIMNIRKHYTWESHATSYMKQIGRVFAEQDEEKMKVAVPSDVIGRRLAKLNYFIIANIDNTLIGGNNEHLPELVTLLQENKEYLGFGLATGRTIDSAKAFLEKHHVPLPDVLITSVGAEIYYGKNLQPGRGWETHISARWNREKIVALFKDLTFLQYQKNEVQRRFNISYEMEPVKDGLARIHGRLLKNKCRYNLIYSQNRYLDILPYRASKGKAIRYLSYKWEIPLSNFLACGDSGNDEEMLRGEPRGVVVGNYSAELKNLKGIRGIYFARQKHSAGVLEGVKKYRFIEKASQQ